MTVKTMKMGVHWEGMAAYYRSFLLGELVKAKGLAKGSDYGDFLDTALECIAYARFIEAGYAKCDCGCEDK